MLIQDILPMSREVRAFFLRHGSNQDNIRQLALMSWLMSIQLKVIDNSLEDIQKVRARNIVGVFCQCFDPSGEGIKDGNHKTL